MSRMSHLMLRFENWPAEDQSRWQAAFKTGDRFDESGRGAHLEESTRKVWQESYARFLGFISANHRNLLTLPPEARIDRKIVSEYVTLAPKVVRRHDGLHRPRPSSGRAEVNSSR
jgi:hypothetical protein